jgi:hypothetical protein
MDPFRGLLRDLLEGDVRQQLIGQQLVELGITPDGLEDDGLFFFIT